MTRLTAFLIPLSIPFVVLAASGPEVTPELLASKADRVVVAEVASVRTEGEAPHLRTVTQLFVRESWKGRGPELLEVVQLGGAAGAFRVQVVGDAQFVPGEQVVAFLRCGRGDGSEHGAARTDRCTVVGMSQGRMTLRRDARDGIEVLVGVPERGATAPRWMPLPTLRARLRVTDVAVEPPLQHPVPAPAASKSAPTIVAPQGTRR